MIASAAPDAPGPLGLPGLDIQRIDHIGVAVADLDAALSWYCGVLGGQVTHRERNDEQQVEEAMVAFGPGAGSGDGPITQIQVLMPTGPDSAIARFLDRSGPGLQQLAVQVSDVDAAAAALSAAGYRMLYPVARRGTADSRINFVHPKDAGGVLLELVEPAAPNSTTESEADTQE